MSPPRYLKANEGDGEGEAGKPPPPSPLLPHPLAFQAVQLGSRKEHQQKGQTEPEYKVFILHSFSPAPEVITLSNLAVFAVTGYGQKGDAKPNLETIMK